MGALLEKFTLLKEELSRTVLGQKELVERLLLALLADGHLLVEGAPGLAKTKSIKALSYLIEGDFHRIQFTPDLLPADITGTEVFHPETQAFSFQRGPIFHNLILADEVNRAAAKVQSALLEAMGEKQVSVGNKTYSLPKLFLVMATQNPIEQEGTFNLPEAQLDRFMLKVVINYPDITHERAIMRLNREEQRETSPDLAQCISQSEIFGARQEVAQIHMDPAVEEYIVQLVIATRQAKKYDDKLADLIEYGASPRASIFFDRAARALAWLRGKDFVAPSDVQQIAHEILRHRIGISFEAASLGRTSDDIISNLLDLVPTP